MESTLIYHMGCIKAHFCHNRKRIFHNTNVKVPQKVLDNRGLIKSKGVDNWQNLNEQVLIYKRQLDEAILNDLRLHGHIDVDRIKTHVRSIGQSTTVNEDHKVDKGLYLLSEMLMDFLSHQPKMNRGLQWRYNLLSKIVSKNNAVCKSIKVPYLGEILDEFRSKVNANTASTRYKNFKRFITWCIDNEYPLSNVEWKRLNNPTFKPDFIFLTDQRIQELTAWKPDDAFHGNVRDIFLVLIYTGMRYSDYESLNLKSEIHDGCIDKVAKKTKVRFKVPIHEVIKSIIKNPPVMAGQTFNKGVKELGAKIGWNEIIRYRKDIDEFAMVPFHKALRSSVGRHTFATRALLNGIPHNIIMGWCGWTNSSMLFYYSEKMKLQTTDWMAKLK